MNKTTFMHSTDDLSHASCIEWSSRSSLRHSKRSGLPTTTEAMSCKLPEKATCNIIDYVGYPASFTGAIHGIKCDQSYVEAVREEAKAAGDICSRVIFVASVIGAKYGTSRC
jgi:hypothetical protein